MHDSWEAVSAIYTTYLVVYDNGSLYVIIYMKTIFLKRHRLCDVITRYEAPCDHVIVAFVLI